MNRSSFSKGFICNKNENRYTEIPGTVIFYAGNTPPIGWIKANGAAISRSTYSNLYSVIGTTFGSGNGSTTFNIPDLRGEFIRGWDDSRGVDSARAFGSSQTDDFKSHTHNVTIDSGSAYQTKGAYADSSYGGKTYTSSATGGTETRPRNIALLACIKY